MSEPYYATSRDAERAFYDAFQAAELGEMMKIWSAEDGIICIHPMGPRLEGREAVAQSWRHIFSGGTPMRFELTEAEARSLLELAGDEVANASQLYGFTRVVKDNFDHDERVELMEMLWEVVYADGALHDLEASLMRRIAGLIYVPDRESGAARKRAMSRLGLD